MIRPVRGEASVFLSTVKAQVPLELPEDVENVIQETSFEATQDVLAVTETDFVPPEAVTDVVSDPSESATARFPQSELLKTEPAEFFASTQ